MRIFLLLKNLNIFFKKKKEIIIIIIIIRNYKPKLNINNIKNKRNNIKKKLNTILELNIYKKIYSF